MNTKVVTVAVVLLVASAGALFAQQAWGFGGRGDRSEAGSGPVMQQDDRGGFRGDAHGGFRRRRGGGMRGGMMGAFRDAEEIELSGTIQLTEDEAPVLRVGSEEYTLIVHPALAEEIDVSSGARISVEGLAITRAESDLTGDESIVMVRVMQVGNTRYVMPAPR